MKQPTRKTPAKDSTPGRAKKPAGLQPRATGASRGSPVAPVMKQFAKTRAESSGGS